MTHSALVLAIVALAAFPVGADIDHAGLDSNGQCVGDSDGDTSVVIHELIQAVNNALGGCPLRPVTLQFKGMVGHDEFACGSAYDGIGTSSSRFLPSDFRFYVSDVHLVTPAGDEVAVTLEQNGMWQHQNVALIDFENGSGACNNGNEATNTAVHGTVPAGVYTGVRFTLGLPFELNHGDASTAPLPLNFTAMFWSWQSGYKFLRVDTADDTFRVHLGSTGCDGPGPSRPPTSCARPNRSNVALSGFDPEHNVIVADLEALLAGNDIDSNDPETPPGCMSDPLDADCEPLFANLGLSFPGGAPLSGQKFFRVESSEAEAGHVEILVGSNADGSGALALHAEFDIAQAIPVPFATCLGGTDDECSGGTRVHQVANPGINPADQDDPEDSFYALDDGVEVILEVTEITPGLSVRFDETVVDSVGDTADLGETPEFHADPETQIAIPPGSSGPNFYQLSFRVRASSGAHDPSPPVTVRFVPTAEADHGGGEHEE